MVPGMTERDRLVADTQRLEWLSGAGIGPARRTYEPAPPRADFSGNGLPVLPLGVWRRGRSPAMVPGERIRLRQP